MQKKHLDMSNSDHSRDYDILLKIVLIGDSAVGKTSMLQRFAEQQFLDSHITTIGVDFKLRTIQIGDTRVKLQVWDTAGQEKFRVITKAYYRNASGILIVYDITNADSFVNTKRWIEEVKENCGDDDNGISIILVGNKCDCEAQRVVALDDLKSYAQAMNLKYFEASAKSNMNIDEVFHELTRLILEKKERSKNTNLNLSNQNNKKKNTNNVILSSSSKSKSNKKCC